MIMGPFAWVTLLAVVLIHFWHPPHQLERKDMVRKVVASKSARTRQYRSWWAFMWWSWATIAYFIVFGLLLVGYFFFLTDSYYVDPMSPGYGSTNFELVLGFHFAALVVFYISIRNFDVYMYDSNHWTRRIATCIPNFVAWCFEVVAVVFIFVEIFQTGQPLSTVTEVMAPLGSLLFLVYLLVYLIWYFVLTSETTTEVITKIQSTVEIKKSESVEVDAAKRRK